MKTAFQNKDLALYIDHTLLRADASSTEFKKICQEAIQHHLYAVCVPGRFVKLVKSELLSTRVKVAAVIGFPLGNQTSVSKAFETSIAVEDGADEVDMVISLGGIREKNWTYVTEDIQSVVKAAKGKAVKVILETHLLNQEEKVKAIESAIQAKAHFIKTSTGFSGGGATLEDISLMKTVAAGRIKIKASGGVKSFDQAVGLIQAGADRIGTSSGVALVTNSVVSGGY
ncbi:MAG: deoxyribose-phosphate aldolase [Bdellovibrionales bacterium]